MKAYVKQPSGNQLYQSSQDKSKDKDHSFTHHMSSALNRIEQSKNGQYSETIHRADRTIQKTSVYHLSKCNRMEDNFNNPSSKRIKQKIQTYLKICHSTNHYLYPPPSFLFDISKFIIPDTPIFTYTNLMKYFVTFLRYWNITG